MLQMITAYIADRLNREEGASMVEYGLLVALIAVVVAVAATTLGTSIAGIFGEASADLGATTTTTE